MTTIIASPVERNKRQDVETGRRQVIQPQAARQLGHRSSRDRNTSPSWLGSWDVFPARGGRAGCGFHGGVDGIIWPGAW